MEPLPRHYQIKVEDKHLKVEARHGWACPCGQFLVWNSPPVCGELPCSCLSPLRLPFWEAIFEVGVTLKHDSSDHFDRRHTSM